MAEIKRLFLFRHLRSEASSFVLHYRDGDLVRSGRGLAFWFYPLSTSVAEGNASATLSLDRLAGSSPSNS